MQALLRTFCGGNELFYVFNILKNNRKTENFSRKAHWFFIWFYLFDLTLLSSRMSNHRLGKLSINNTIPCRKSVTWKKSIAYVSAGWSSSCLQTDINIITNQNITNWRRTHLWKFHFRRLFVLLTWDTDASNWSTNFQKW